MVQIFLNGYGNIGRRLATAFSKDKSMELIGIAKYSPDVETEKALKNGYKVFVPKETEKEFKSKNYDVTGNIEDAIKQADLIIDAAKEGRGFQNKQKYYIRIVFFPRRVVCAGMSGKSGSACEGFPTPSI